MVLWWFSSALRVVVSIAGGWAESWMFSALALAWEDAAALQLPGQTAAWRTAAPEFFHSDFHDSHHQCEHPQTRRCPTEESGEIQVTQLWFSPATEGVTCTKGGSTHILHIPALQPQTRAASADDGATDPRFEQFCWCCWVCQSTFPKHDQKYSSLNQHFVASTVCEQEDYLSHREVEFVSMWMFLPEWQQNNNTVLAQCWHIIIMILY